MVYRDRWNASSHAAGAVALATTWGLQKDLVL